MNENKKFLCANFINARPLPGLSPNVVSGAPNGQFLRLNQNSQFLRLAESGSAIAPYKQFRFELRASWLGSRSQQFSLSAVLGDEKLYEKLYKKLYKGLYKKLKVYKKLYKKLEEAL